MNFTKLKQFKLKSLSHYLAASLISTVIGLIINPFLALSLSHKDYAIIGYFASFATILIPIFAFSFNSYYARNYFLVDDQQREKMLQTLLSVFLVFGLIMFIVFFVIYYYYHKKYISSIPFSPYALLSFLPLYFGSFYNIYLLDLRMQNKAKVYAFVTILNSILTAILSLLLIYVLKYGAEGRLVALLIVGILFGVYSLKAEKFRFVLDKKIVKDAISFCWPLAISAVLTYFFMGIDRTFLAQLNDNYTLGLYNVAMQISGYLSIFGIVLFQAFGPDLYKYTSLNQHKRVLQIVLLLTFIPLIPNLLFIALSKPLINLLTYGRYVDAVSFTNILCLKNVSYCFAFSLSDAVVGYGYAKYELYNKIIGAFLSILLYKYLIGNFGFYGAAYGQTLSWVIMGLISIVSLFYAHNKLKSKKID